MRNGGSFSFQTSNPSPSLLNPPLTMTTLDAISHRRRRSEFITNENHTQSAVPTFVLTIFRYTG